MRNEFKEYADAAGLKERDMPSPHHPLLENDDEVNSLSDLLNVRVNPSQSPLDFGERTRSDDSDDTDYMGRQDVVDSMLSSDPDADAGMDADETVGGALLDRAPDITGTVTGLARGTATHLPQDIGADGFQILEPEEAAGELIVSSRDQHQATGVSPDEDGGRIPITKAVIDNADDALDATRTLI